MKSLILKQAERFLREQKNYKRWLAVFLCLAVVVVIGTTAALKYKGIAVTTDNEEVEVHMEEETGSEDTEATSGHVHTDDCYEEREVLVCDAAKSAEGHKHDSSCYEVAGGEEKLVCDKEEHSHSDGCYEIETVSETVTETETDEDGNEHEVERTVEHEEKTLACGEEEHSHGSSCYETEGGEKTLICGMEEGEGVGAEESGHVHDESCYQTERVLVCGKEEGESEEELLEEDISGNDLEEAPLEKIFEDDSIKVIAKYSEDAKIPADAELLVEQITKEKDPDHYAKREAEFKEELDNEDAVMDMLLNIGFFVDGSEIEPKDTVTITIQMKKDGLEVGDEITVVHFGDKETKKLDASGIEEDREGNKITSFATDSFSDFAIGLDVMGYAASGSCTIQYIFQLSEEFKNAEIIEVDGRFSINEIRSGKVTEEVEVETFSDEYGGEYSGYRIRPLNGILVKMGRDYHYFDLGEGWLSDKMNVSSNTENIELMQSGYLKDENGIIKLKGVLNERKVDGHSFSEVRFYINKTGTVADTTGNTGTPKAEDFTESVFSTTTNALYKGMKYNYAYARINSGPSVYTEMTDQAAKVIEAGSSSNTSMGDENIRKLSSAEGVEVTNKKTGEKYTYRLVDFPTDEAVFEKLRNMPDGTIKIDGAAVESTDLTADNFTIRWYVFKFNCTDAWHIDGVLVRKQGQIAVTKTFYGDKTAIEAVVKDNFNITVSEEGKTETAYTLKLHEKTDSDTPNDRGYDHKEEKGEEVTYTWVLGVTASKTFTIKENNYQYSENNIGTLAEYRISNTTKNGSQEKTTVGDWQNYPAGGVPVTTESYPSDVDYKSYQTVNLRNSYLPKNSINIWKYDKASVEGLTGVTFELRKDASPVNVYKKGTDYYLYSSGDVGESVTTELQVDERGYLTIYGLEKASAGTYTLIETKHPEGYEAEDVTFTINNNGSVTLGSGESAAKLTSLNGVNAYRLAVPNNSETMDITVRKDWGATAEGDRKTVEVELWRGDTKTAHKVRLSEENSWTAEIKGLPAYVNGKLGDYKLREVKIGDTYYDGEADTDGYRVYDVTYSGLQTRTDDNGKMTGTLVVHNAIGGRNLEFTKTDESGKALSGATFALYGDQNCTAGTELQTASSGNVGKVKFIGLTSDVYYMKETAAPNGYAVSEQIYKVTFDGENGRIELYTSETTEEVAQNESEPTGSITSIINTVAKQTINIVKENTNGNRLNGAEFTLTPGNLAISESYTTSNHTSSTVGEEAGVVAKGLELPYGTYTLTETKAPENYTAAHPITLTVTAGGVSVSGTNGEYSLTNDSKEYTLTVKNTLGMLGDIMLTKVSDQNSATKLPGAKFILSRTVDGKTEYAVISGSDATWVTAKETATEIETGNDGTAALPKLGVGSYSLTETKAPDGYNLLETSVGFEVRISASGGLVLAIPDGSTANIDNLNIIISNSTGLELPQTGGPGTVAYTFGGLAVIAVSLMYGLGMRRKRRKGGLN